MMTRTTARPTLKTTEPTDNAVRKITAELTGVLGGRRVTHDRVIAALVQVGDAHREELLEALLPDPE